MLHSRAGICRSRNVFRENGTWVLVIESSKQRQAALESDAGPHLRGAIKKCANERAGAAFARFWRQVLVDGKTFIHYTYWMQVWLTGAMDCRVVVSWPRVWGRTSSSIYDRSYSKLLLITRHHRQSGAFGLRLNCARVVTRNLNAWFLSCQMHCFPTSFVFFVYVEG